MPDEPAIDPERERINDALDSWRQGDYVRGEHWFLYRLAVRAPLTEAASVAAEEDIDAAEEAVAGFMVATQTCDIVRDCLERPFVEVSPLVEVDADILEDVRKGRRPRYAYVPGASDERLVADLDRAMTVEKGVVADWERNAGCEGDRERRHLALNLARNRARTAFPDDFVRFASGLRDRILKKHGKNSDEGRALRALREIRVRAAPAWDADEIDLLFYFIRDDDQPNFERSGWDEYLEKWLAFMPVSGRFRSVDGVVQTLGGLTAQDYVESDALDLDYLSTPAAE